MFELLVQNATCLKVIQSQRLSNRSIWPNPCHWLVSPPVPLLVIDGLRVWLSIELGMYPAIDDYSIVTIPT
jgi:hypothetical protein